MSALPILYNFRRCPYAMRARLALIIAQVQCELREVDLGNKPQSMLDVSPKGTVPVLLFADDSVLDESLDIMLWTFSQADMTAWLNPESGKLDDMLELIGRNDGEFKYHLDRYKYPDRYLTENSEPRHQRQQACGFLSQLETLLNNNDFLFGPHPSLADIAIFPFVRQFAGTEREWFTSLDYPRLHAWLNGWLNSELFANTMQKNFPWPAGEAPVYLMDPSP